METTRRHFIQTGAVGTVASRLAASDRFSLGIIGFGKRGNELRRYFEKFPEVNMVAVADLYDGYLQNAREVINEKILTTKEYQAILDRKDIDAVAIATPEHWHLRMVLDALSAGKDIYCEKPLTFTVDEGAQIVKAAKNSSRILQVGSQGKTSPATAKAREIIKSGVLGKLNLVMSNSGRNSLDGAWRYPIPPDASPQTVDWNRFLGNSPKLPWNQERFFHWRNYWEYSGGIATDMFVHTLCTMHEILDVKLPKSVVSHGGNYQWKDGRTVPDLMTSVFEYPGDFQIELCVNLECSKMSAFTRGPAFMGSEAAMVMGGREGIMLYREDPNLVRAQYAGPLPRKWREQFEAERKKLEPLPKPRDVETIEIPGRGDDVANHVGLFVRSVKDRTPSVEDAETGHNAATAAHMANYALLHNCRAGLDPKSGKLKAI